MEFYRILAEREVDPFKRLIADFAVRTIVVDLAIEEPRVHVIKPVASGNFSFPKPVDGLCWPGGKAVYIRHYLAGKDLVAIIAHELKHAAQFQHYTHRFDKALDERDAEIYAREFVILRLGNPPVDQLFPALRKLHTEQFQARRSRSVPARLAPPRLECR